MSRTLPSLWVKDHEPSKEEVAKYLPAYRAHISRWLDLRHRRREGLNAAGDLSSIQLNDDLCLGLSTRLCPHGRRLCWWEPAAMIDLAALFPSMWASR